VSVFVWLNNLSQNTNIKHFINHYIRYPILNTIVHIKILVFSLFVCLLSNYCYGGRAFRLC